MIFAKPLFLLLTLPVLALFYWRRRQKMTAAIRFPSVKGFQVIAATRAQFLLRCASSLYYVVLVLMIVALAQPQKVSVDRELTSQGIDIVLALDTSGSMKAEDFKPDNRLVVAKESITQFVMNRKGDRMGLVVFGTDAFTLCPLTMDHKTLVSFLSRVTIGMAGEETAIGLAISMGLNRLKNSKAKSKVMILLTDGENNQGMISPEKAADFARELGVKIYTIGVGKEGGAPIPYEHPVYGKKYYRYPDGSLALTKIDEETLKTVAYTTQGQYFRATDSEGLKRIYEQIDAMETSEIKTKQFYEYHDYFPLVLSLVLFLMVLQFILSRLMVVPIP